MLSWSIFAGKPSNDTVNDELKVLITTRNLSGLEERLKKFSLNEEYKRYNEEDSYPYLPPELLKNAVRTGDFEIAKLLIEYNYPTFVKFYQYYDDESFDGLQLGHWGAAIFNNDLKMLTLLQRNNIPLYNYDLLALYKSNVDVISLLIDAGHDIGEYTIREGFLTITTPLDICLKRERLDLAEYLIKNHHYNENIIYHDINDRMGGILGESPDPQFIVQRYPQYSELFSQYGLKQPTYDELLEFDEFKILESCNMGSTGDIVRRLKSRSHYSISPKFQQYSYVINRDNKMGVVAVDNLQKI